MDVVVPPFDAAAPDVKQTEQGLKTLRFSDGVIQRICGQASVRDRRDDQPERTAAGHGLEHRPGYQLIIQRLFRGAGKSLRTQGYSDKNSSAWLDSEFTLEPVPGRRQAPIR